MRLDEAVGRGGEEPLVDRAIADDATVLVLPNIAHDAPRLVDQAAVLHESGLRVRSLSQFYEDWLGKLPIGELERVSLMFDIAELHHARYAGQAAARHRLRCARHACPAPVIVFVAVGNQCRTGAALLPSGTRRGAGVHHVEVRVRVVGEPPTMDERDDPRITPFRRFLRRSPGRLPSW
jgi:hypothetical protein